MPMSSGSKRNWADEPHIVPTAGEPLPCFSFACAIVIFAKNAADRTRADVVPRRMTWTVHIANAQGQLDGFVEPIRNAIESARKRCEAVLDPLPIDVVVQAWPGRVIPERGYVGHAPTGTMMQLTVDPANPNLSRCLGETLERMVAHEFHHVCRWRGPGYGRTLGEALVSEGLAG